MDEIVIEVCNPDAVQMLQKGDADAFVEEAAEVLAAEAELRRNGFESDGFRVVSLNVCQNLLDLERARFPFGEIFFYKRD